MTEIVLTKRQIEVNFDLHEEDYIPRTVDAEWVVGLSLPASKPVWEYKYKPDGSETEESLNLETVLAERIVDFYERTKARRHNKRPFHNCHMLAWYAVGAITTLDHYMYYSQTAVSDSVATDALEPGQTYSILSSGDELKHSLIGTHRPDYSLSVLGDYSAMAVVDNAKLMDAYQGTTLVATSPLCASIKSEVGVMGLHIHI